MHRPSVASLLLPALVLLGVTACGGQAPTPTPSPSPAAVASAEDAFDAVRVVTPLFDGVGPRQDDAIGQAAWWTATREGDTWSVAVSVGWGDCESGCIDRHEWTWRVTSEGSVDLIAEQGSPLVDEVVAELHADADAQGVGGIVVAGPICPVEQPGDPACAPRPVDGATLSIQDASGKEVARHTTDASGLYRIALAPGTYTLVPSAVEGYMGGASPATFDVLADAETWLTIGYDTGIR